MPESEAGIQFASPTDDVAVIKIQGRASFKNSMDFQRLAQNLRGKNSEVRLIIDLEKCITMNSTFMGTLAGISKAQKEAGVGYTTIVNANEHVRKLLKTLGISFILDMRQESQALPIQAADFQKAKAGKPVSRFEQIVHMISAHKQLIDLDSHNEVRFQSVIKYLQDSLEREKKKQAESPPPDTIQKVTRFPQSPDLRNTAPKIQNI